MTMVKERMETGKVQAAMGRRERGWWWLAVGQVALGVWMTLAVPLGMSWVLELRILWRGGLGATWGTGAVVLGVAMAVAYLVEWRTRGEWLEGQLRDLATPSGLDWGTDRFWRYERASGVFVIEMFLWVPRMVFEGVARLRAAGKAGLADRRRAAEVLGALLQRGRGTEAATLRRSGEAAEIFGRVMGYLMLYEWVGMSEDEQRVWASTEGKEALVGEG